MSYLLIMSCSEPVTVKENKTYQVIHPLVKDTIYEREYAATINSIINVDIRNRIKGFIEEIYMDEGRHVNKGQLLFRLNSAELEQMVRKADVLIQTAEAELRTVESSFDLYKAVRVSYLDVLLSQQSALQANLELIRINQRSRVAQVRLFRNLGGTW